MVKQTPLDFSLRSHVRRRRLPTEVAAAASALERASDSCRSCYEAIACSPGGLTDDELRSVTGLYSARRRRADLKNAGLIEASGETRPGPTGSDMTVWTVVEET